MSARSGVAASSIRAMRNGIVGPLACHRVPLVAHAAEQLRPGLGAYRPVRAA